MLMVVIGLICLVVSAFYGLASMFRLAYEQGRFLRVAGIYLGAGMIFFLVLYFIFILPEQMRARRSATWQRRHGSGRTKARRYAEDEKRINQNQAGGILVAALALLGLLSALSVQVITTARAAQTEAAAHAGREQLRMAALDEVRFALQTLADDTDLTIDHGAEAWAQPRETVDPAGIERVLRVEDLAARFDLNNLAVEITGDSLRPYDALVSVMNACGIFTPGLQVDALRDWVDADGAGTYEDEHYGRKEPAYTTAGRVLYGFDELFAVEGWEAGMFERDLSRSRLQMFDGDLIDAVTIIPAPRDRVIPLNVNTASPGALLGLIGVGGEPLVERIVARRREAPISRLDFIAFELGDDRYARLTPYLDLRSEWFLIQAAAYRDGHSERIEVVARRSSEGAVDIVRSSY
jgi:type II secretory pathway component PulK